MTMAQCEIDSFVKKFKLLWSAGYDSSLNLESKLGEVYVTLNCKVGRSIPPPTSPISPAKYRSPSYFRRQERRKAARESEFLVSSEAACNIKTDEVFDTVESSEATKKVEELESQAFEQDAVAKEIEANEEVAESNEAEDVDQDELDRDRLIEDILVYRVKGGLPQPLVNREVAEKEIESRFAAIGVTVKSMKTFCNHQGNFEHSRVKTTPVNLKTIWGRRLGLKYCSVIAYEPPP